MEKIITVKNPWAYKIFYYGKDVENRNWRTSYRGKLYIHTSLKSDDLKEDKEIEKKLGIKLLYGYIIGYVYLIDIVNDSKSKWAEEGKHHWIISMPKLLKKPIKARGFPGLWKL